MVAGYSDTTKGEWEQIVKDFEAKNPGITVNLSVQSWTDINDVITTRIQSHKAPDILNIDAYATYANEGLLYPAKDVASPQLLADFQPSFVKNASIGGTQWGLPFLASARQMFYNKDIFAKAGVSAPPKTWAEFETDAQKIKDSGEIAYGMPLGAEEAQGESALWFYGAGGGYGDSSKVTVDTPQNVEGAQEMQKLIKAGVTEQDPGSTDRDPLLNVFYQGKIGMMVGLPQTVVQIKAKNPKLNYGIAPIATKDGSPFTLGVADHFMAFKNDTDKTAAMKKFFDYFYSAPVYSKWVAAEGFLPVTKSGAEALKSNQDIKPFVEALPDAKFYPAANPKWPVAQSALQHGMGQLAQGTDPASLLKEIQAKVDQ
jgi:multiple sugar transport system substrate-binding protein